MKRAALEQERQLYLFPSARLAADSVTLGGRMDSSIALEQPQQQLQQQQHEQLLRPQRM